MPLTSPDNRDMTREEVEEVQKRLLAHGFDPGPADGIIGPRTNAAISAFKKSIGFVARPWVGKMTWDRLMAAPTNDNDTLPPWVLDGLRIKGWHERTHNADLRAWLKSDGSTLGDPAVLPWCGDFVHTAIRLALAGEPFPGDLGKNPYWALNWRQFGVACDPCVGAVVSITRSGGGHVGFAIGQDASRIFVLGGNQGNMVSVAPIEKSRFSSASWRWPSTYSGSRKPLPFITSAEASASNFS